MPKIIWLKQEFKQRMWLFESSVMDKVDWKKYLVNWTRTREKMEILLCTIFAQLQTPMKSVASIWSKTLSTWISCCFGSKRVNEFCSRENNFLTKQNSSNRWYHAKNQHYFQKLKFIRSLCVFYPLELSSITHSGSKDFFLIRWKHCLRYIILNRAECRPRNQNLKRFFCLWLVCGCGVEECFK